MLFSRHHTVIDAGAGAPEWVHLVPAGVFKGVDGRGPYRLGDPAAVIAASMAGGSLAVDENHATDHAAETGAPSPARGWIVEMQARDDGLWGRVEWTPSGRQLMAERAYRGISPVFEHDKAGGVLRVLRAALTNTPNLAQLATLHSTETSTMDLALLRAALALPETADEAAILAAAQAAGRAVAAHGAALAQIATAAGLDATLAPAAIATALQAQRSTAGDTAQMAQQLIALQTQLATLQAAGAQERATAFVDAAIRAGKPINPLRAHFIARHVADAAAVETEINALPSINAGGVASHASGGGTDDETPTAEEMAIARKMGMDPKKLVAQRKKRMAGGDDGEKV